jgi:LDH2 family malate/lactate/ureidoglycolate dehydrogenase
MRIDAFRPADEFKSAMDQWIKTFRSARPARGETRVLIPGDPEREAEKINRQSGIKLVPAVVDDLKAIAAEQGMSFSDKR